MSAAAETQALDEVLAAIEKCVSGGDAEEKRAALRGLTALVDPTDESYSAQRAAAERLLPAVLMQLLEDDDAGVAVEAANALAALTDHCATARDRVESSHFGATPEKVSLNPVQEEVGEMEGVFNVLVNMRFSADDVVATAGTEALAALTSLNRANEIALMREIVKRLSAGEARALGALDDLLVGLDIRDDAAVLLDMSLAPALGFVRGGTPAEKNAAAGLLASIAEGRRGAAPFLVAEGALPLTAALLVDGDLEARDTAVRLLWALVKDNRRLLSPEKGGLGLAGTRLVEPLLELVEKGEARANAEDRGSEDEGEGDDGAGAGGEVAVDNGDAALLLLRALAVQDEAVSGRLKGEGGLIATRSCAIM
ncbi:hypothetical protein Rsub_07735 [Raphidocelis subcapitata]|uniref:Uncharacterized protein n=1 Tax=Raphidocelis subcapitata TaxID=307507 RepID=A0A2V0P5K0_9CHLO|nr:hypothetical protein Rsub_07735 [Raphidocelis subcapitata]|eukprot:GBF95151.1 hypothetical protein Rsub_07735 [Raphidocelis subcapitata]